VKVLHVLSQRPLRTGSGVTLDATVRLGGAAGHAQAAVVGTPWDDPTPPVGDLPAEAIHPLRFGEVGLDFRLPGMSDVMPYPSTVFSSMSGAMLAAYRRAWEDHVRRVLDRFQPEVIHSHHLWILSSLLKDLAPEVPVVTQSHATGLRQMHLCPHLAEEVRAGCRRNDAFLALHAGHAQAAAEGLGVAAERVHVVGAGYREDVFHASGRDPEPGSLLYAGKLARAKGLPWLIDAVERLDDRVTLHVAGGGAGDEADALRARLEASPRCRYHGSLNQRDLAWLMRRSQVFVLPSFYEGLPLVLVEALAAGCRLVATDLDVVRSDLAPRLGEALTRVPLPPLVGVDEPDPDGLPAFTDRLEAALNQALAAPPLDPGALAETLEGFTWPAVYGRIETIWRQSAG
jgi:glycosyltransferase involved in cell wall biosynthesis